MSLRSFRSVCDPEEIPNFEEEFYEMPQGRDLDGLDLECDYILFKAIDSSPAFLNNVDYTLNRPMTVDGIENFIKFACDIGYKKVFKRKALWDKRKKWLSDCRIELSNSTSPTDYHRDVADLLLRTNINCDKIKELIKKTDQDAKMTHEVVRSFYKAWINENIPFKSRSQSSYECLKYGAYMLDFYIMTLFLNASTYTELETLCNQFKASIHPVDIPTSSKKGKTQSEERKGYGVMYESTTCGKIYIGYGVIWLASLKSLWDRDMVLMFKDLATARFHTLFSMEHRQFFQYHHANSKKIANMYKEGDLLLKKYKCDAYEVIGMVEPVTSYELSLLAGDHRPLIPEFPAFPKHLREKSEKLVGKMPDSIRFLRCLKEMKEKDLLLTAYGSFRHWGHPFIDYMRGLEALYSNVTSTEFPIDQDYAELLASDLAYKVIYGQYHKHRTWYVDPSLLPDKHPLKNFIINKSWPDESTLKGFTSGWHKLPLTKCWEIPETVDPALIYSDKSHSINKDEMIDFLRKHFHESCPTRKVLETFIYNPATDWPKFLKEINDHGLTAIHKIIGLKLKERELKLVGRFFALMSWPLREYFVFTEYLIKKEIIPLFEGLTMADDQTTLMKKMTINTAGQGEEGYETITIANHIDYNKWNNFQRKEATNPVFRVMGQFFGYPNLFTRTHEFFEESLIYYKDRPDLLDFDDNDVFNKDDKQRVSWNGQAGGLEGLRQKGWSVLNLLVLERESRSRNTEVRILAQGDNQVIFNKYKVDPYDNEEELKEHLKKIVQNNEAIMNKIREATLSIGLKINNDETLQSADMTVYGKVIVFRGNPTCLEEKKLSRVTCTTNDQLPSLANLLATVSTNCLTIAHYSKSPKNSMVNYNWLGNFALNLLNLHNPAIRASPYKIMKEPKLLDDWEYRTLLLYLDPSLGGVSGMSLTRFMIRMFPDPITEGLTFWKMVHDGTGNHKLRSLCCKAGNPRLRQFLPEHFSKIVEDPTSLNTFQGISANQLLKEEIKKSLVNHSDQIKNEIVKDAVLFRKAELESFISFLASIKPCFPRFLSELKSSTYFGITDGILGLFENSKTIRNLLKRKFKDTVDSVIVRSEVMGLESIVRCLKRSPQRMWSCSAKKADELRRQSWDRDVVGMTNPHAAEFIRKCSIGGFHCRDCKVLGSKGCYITVIVPKGIKDPENKRGPYPPYFGSTTNESTGLLRTYEKETDIPFLDKAGKMRDTFHWFVTPDGPLGKSIMNNLKGLTGEDPGTVRDGFKRTGSPLHRFGCSRISAGGFMASSSVYASRMLISTDVFKNLGDKNYDFMYQSLMLYSQLTVGEIHNESEAAACYHLHITCESCLREIVEPNLEAPIEYQFQDKSEILKKWKPEDASWFKVRINIPLENGDWVGLPDAKKCEEVGKIQALMFSVLRYTTGKNSTVLNSLFPVALRNKMQGIHYLNGIRKGLVKAACLSATSKPHIFKNAVSIEAVIKHCYREVVYALCDYPDFTSFCSGADIESRIISSSHKIPPSYPANTFDIGTSVRSVLVKFPKQLIPEIKEDLDWVFSDLRSVKLSAIIFAGHEVVKILHKNSSDAHKRNKCRELNDWYSVMLKGEVTGECLNMINQGRIKGCESEVRHAIKSELPSLTINDAEMIEPFEDISSGRIYSVPVDFTSISEKVEPINFPRHQNPLISGIRIPQIATGAFMKLRTILHEMKPNIEDAMCLADGSGGCSSCILRMYPSCRLIFNSLIEMNGVHLNGTLPSPPSAIRHMSMEVRDRCANLNNAWEYSTDLSLKRTWEDLTKLASTNLMKINFIFLDMELSNESTIQAIESNLIEYLIKNTSVFMTLILKTYAHRLLISDGVLFKVGNIFSQIFIIQTDWSSSQTSEVYLYCTGKRKDQNLTRYPDLKGLKPRLKDIFSLQDYDTEFKRAVRVLRIDACKGIPKRFLPDPGEQLFSIWYAIAPKSILLANLEEVYLLTNKNDPIQSTICILMVVMNQVISIFRWFKTPGMIPSNQELKQVFSFYVGSWLYISLINNDVTIGRKTQNLINSPFRVNFHFIEEGHMAFTIDESGVKQSQWIRKYRLEWNINGKESELYKVVNLTGNLALIGSIIRYSLALNKKNKRDPSVISTFNQIIKKFEPRYDYSQIKVRSSVFLPLMNN